MLVLRNENWVERLRSTGYRQEQAIAELREVLLRGLAINFQNQYDSRFPAEDIVQETLIKVLTKLDTFEGRSKLTTWAMGIAVRLTFSEMRRKRFKDVSIETLAGNDIRFEPVSRTGHSAFAAERNSLLAKQKELIETELSEKQRSAVLSLLRGMPVEVFAEKTGSNRNAVHKLVHDARLKLRKGLEAAGYQAQYVRSLFV